ncbi:MAG: hypothetical protein KM312_10005 [Hydrogenibacillus schlegelii]|uniref:Uncharacterized protein n=1 Tax=Hydrogenibacillus schlegelii TaxID=1484 RepID=A0A947CYI3_HYDSH|nr:hypothetical protein [Hydrogenibacillus schlegelii]
MTEHNPRPEHLALPGFVYGGLIASLIDCHSPFCPDAPGAEPAPHR